MKRKFKLLAAALAAITAMSCTSATAFADLSSDLATISNQLSDNTDLSKLPIYNLSSNVPIKLNEYTDFSCDMVDCCLVSEEIYHISTMLSFQEKYDEWDKLMQDMRSYTNKKIPINSYEKLRKHKPFGILINVDGKCPGLLYRINDDILICAYYDIKYDNSGNIISLTNDKSMVNYCICNKLSASVLYKNCWYTSATDKDFTVYIGKNGLPVTKNSTIDGVRYIFNKYGKCEGKYTGWAKNSKGKVYYKDGVKVTKNTTIGGVRYKFSSDGYCKGKFTGFTKSSQGRKYWSKGILTQNKWVQDPKGNYYYAGSDSYLLTGWQKVTRIGGTYSYFDENGVWDGKIHKNGYVRNDLRSVFKDYDFFAGEKYYYNFNNHSADKMKPLDGVDVLREIIEKDLDTPLLWADFDDDEIEPSDELYYGGRKIVIRSSVSNNIDFEITRDNDGNSYLYNAYFGFGLKLTDSDAYDKIMVLLTFQG